MSATEQATPLRPRSRLDAAVYGLVVATIALGLAGPPLAAALDPRLPVSAAFHVDGAARDPWGTPWVLLDGRPWSLGPDRLADARGGAAGADRRGDDVPVLDERDGWLQVYRGGGEALFGLAVVLAVLWELLRALRRQLRAPRGPLPAEAGRAALLALAVAPPVLLLLAFAGHLSPAAGPRELLEQLRARMLVPLEVALFGTVYVGTTAVLLGLRLRAPTADELAEDAPPGP